MVLLGLHIAAPQLSFSLANHSLLDYFICLSWTQPSPLSFLFSGFFWGGGRGSIGVCTQGIILAKQALYHLS
jgi:hypothetical protein